MKGPAPPSVDHHWPPRFQNGWPSSPRGPYTILYVCWTHLSGTTFPIPVLLNYCAFRRFRDCMPSRPLQVFHSDVFKKRGARTPKHLLSEAPAPRPFNRPHPPKGWKESGSRASLPGPRGSPIQYGQRAVGPGPTRWVPPSTTPTGSRGPSRPWITRG